MSYVRQTLTKMAGIMAAAYQFASIRCCGHSYLVIFIRFPPIIYGLLPLNPCSCSNMSFVGQTITVMADKMATAYQFASLHSCGHSNLVIFVLVLPISIYGLLSSNSGSSFNMSYVRQTIT